MTREKMSRPNSSVPKRCAHDGGRSWSAKDWSIGLYGEMNLAKRLAPTTTATMTRPMIRFGLRTIRRHDSAAARRRGSGARSAEGLAGAAPASGARSVRASPIANSRIEIRVQHVDREVGQHEDCGRDDDDAPNDRIIPPQHARDRQPA